MNKYLIQTLTGWAIMKFKNKAAALKQIKKEKLKLLFIKRLDS